MNEHVNEITESEQSRAKEALMRRGKVLGGIALGAVGGYAMAKGFEQVMPIDGEINEVYEAAAMIAGAVVAALISSEA
jgi:hypothetical protein